MNCNEWIVKLDPRFESNIKCYPKRLLISLDKEIERLIKNPYIGKNLGPQRPWLWEIHVDIPARTDAKRFRLYYEIWERKCIIYLKAFYPKNLQRKYLTGKIP